MDEIDKEIWDFINALNGNLKDQKADMAHRDAAIEILSEQLAELCEENKNLKRENQQLKEKNYRQKQTIRYLRGKLWDI